MGDTGSELVGLLILIFLVFGIIGIVGFKFINRLAAKRIIKPTTTSNKVSSWKVMIIGVILIITLGTVGCYYYSSQTFSSLF